jgi:hypothetical protein
MGRPIRKTAIGIERAQDAGTLVHNAAALMLASGGDERIWIDPATNRNRYGTTTLPRPDEVFFSSSTASTISPRSFAAVDAAWSDLANSNSSGSLNRLFDDIRNRLLALFGIAGTEVVLAGSGTEAEYIALCLAQSVLGEELTNIVVAPGETGSGVLRAAGGTHFLTSTPFLGAVCPGAPIHGWAETGISVETVEIRDATGKVRPAADIDAELHDRVKRSVHRGCPALIHLLHTSKTGQSGLSLAMAANIAADFSSNTVILVDCCQLRASEDEIRAFLNLGFLVVLTGSKFAGGPAFSGAVLVPEIFLQRCARLRLPEGLAGYSTRQDWPKLWRDEIELSWASAANLGLGLRWIAALDEMERYFALPLKLRTETADRFATELRLRAETVPGLRELQEPSQHMSRSIHNFYMLDGAGSPYSAGETSSLHLGLRSGRPGNSRKSAPLDRLYHVGQPVFLAGLTALRVCASAPIVTRVAEALATGAAPETAYAPLNRDLDGLFSKWDCLIHETRR